MFKTREQIEADERMLLAPQAVHSFETLGRKHRETRHPYRTDFQRDRARVIHSAAFRRLDGKTQVFLNGTGDHYRTRLTHTIEVASITRTIARALGLNEDLAEAVALAHDLGHPPFGHSGEQTLDRLMRGDGGFDHNIQSLRVVETLEEKYPRHAGLNLSYEVLEGLGKHNDTQTLPDGTLTRWPSLEGQIADLADEITYYSHDLDDGLDAGLIDPDALDALAIWSDARVLAEREFKKKFHPLRHRGFVIRCIVNREVEDLVVNTARAVEKSGATSVTDVRVHPKRLAQFSAETRRGNAALRKFLYKNLYYNPAVAQANARGCGVLEGFFHRLVDKPGLLGSKATRRIKTEGFPRSVADYLSGMTDHYCLQEYAKLN